MQIYVRLHGILRDRLPPQAKGRTIITLGEGATVADLLNALALDGYLLIASNEALIEDLSQPLGSDDQVDIFLPVAGG